MQFLFIFWRWLTGQRRPQSALRSTPEPPRPLSAPIGGIPLEGERGSGDDPYGGDTERGDGYGGTYELSENDLPE